MNSSLLLCCLHHLHQVVVSLEEVEDEGLLMSWALSKQPSFALTVAPCKVQRQVRTSDMGAANMICLPPRPGLRLRITRCISAADESKCGVCAETKTHIMQSVFMDESQSICSVLHASHFSPH